MEEKTYRLMSRTGKWSMVLGILTIVAGVTAGVLLIINGARLLAGRKRITF